MSSSPSLDELKAKLNLETSRICWHELQTYFARGQVVRVSPDLDLLDVAAEEAWGVWGSAFFGLCVMVGSLLGKPLVK